MKILVSDPLSAAGIQVLEKAGCDVLQLTEGGRDAWSSILPEIDAWIIRSGTRVTAEDLELAKGLKAIGRAGVGIDNVDLKAATLHGVVVMNTPGGNTVSAAEHTIALLTALARNVHLGDHSLKQGRWDRKKLVGTELSGKTMGIIGLGRIGQEVARRAQGLQMKVIGFDPFLDANKVGIPDISFVSFARLLETADIVSLHLPRTADTIDLIAQSELKQMKSSAFLINCARGGIVNEADLAAALANKQIAGAAIDVYSTEPPPEDHPLLGAPNILLTPHLGASTREAGETVARQVAHQIVDYLKEGILSNAVNLPIADMKILKQIEEELALAEQLGWIQHHLNPGAIGTFQVTFTGKGDHLRPLVFSALKGLLNPRMDLEVNFINAGTIAESRGIHVKSVHDPEYSHIQNVVSIRAGSESQPELEIAGYVDRQQGMRLFRVNQYHLDVLLDGDLLLLTNRDVPGVVGEVGTALAAAGVNIAEYALSRDAGAGTALSIIKCDGSPGEGLLAKLSGIPAVERSYFIPRFKGN